MVVITTIQECGCNCNYKICLARDIENGYHKREGNDKNIQLYKEVFFMNYSVSILPLIIGAVINMALGALWYSPVLFAKVWMKEAGITADYIEVSKGKMGKVYGFTTVMAIITSYIIGFIVLNFGISSILEALVLAVIVWIGTGLPMIIKNWGFEDRSMKLGFINHGYDLAVYVIVSILFVIL